ncbi:hypothetical protein LAZ67_7001725 [Cordylochernes scorpioides]|uniref:Integrase catalytic domain-containing protein n=1 Tax=Cordylochernes scorpioides TaxID=51811 RepID=A0ABY6KMM3_9ARAC|nr:hypothetical protein LAZ67_7001725 [Cordylochernes scorpioides]
MDQRTCIKFCVKNEIKCADAFRMLTVAYGEATLDRNNVYRWYKMFSEGREDVNDEERAGRPSTSTTDEKINEVEKMILANRRITVREVAEGLNISIGSCHSIFINDLGMRRVAAKFVPKLLNCDQKQHRMNIANEMLDSVRDDPNLLQRVITGDEAWVYGYDVETKAQSSQWKLPHEPRPKKARQVRSNVNVLLTVFFDCRGVVHHEFLPQGRTVNKEYYLQVMRNLREAIRQKRPDLWKNKNWLLHHDNASAHTSLLVRDFFAKNNTLMMPRPPYSPDLAPCDFFLFPKLKRPMKGRRYARLDEIKTASKEELKKILKNDFLKCFEDWKNQPVKVDRMTEDSSMQRMTEVRDDYVADALTNMQPHCEDLVSRLKDAMRELAAPRIEKVIIAPINISCATNIFPHRLEQADKIHREIMALPRQPASTMSHGNHRKKRSPSLIAAHSTRPIQDIHLLSCKQRLVEGKTSSYPASSVLWKERRQAILQAASCGRKDVKLSCKQRLVDGENALEYPSSSNLRLEKTLRQPTSRDNWTSHKTSQAKPSLRRCCHERRKAIRGTFTRIINEINGEFEKSQIDKNDIYSKFNRLESYYTKLVDLNEKYQALLVVKEGITEESIDREWQECDKYEEEKFDIQQKVSVLRNPDKEETIPIASEDTVINVKLPELALKSYDGSLEGWLSWWAQFSKIHENKNLSDSDRFLYLRQAIVPNSEAYRVVASYPVTGANYVLAVQALQERFGDPNILTELYVRRLLNSVISNVKKENRNLSSLYDELSSHLRSLETLGIDPQLSGIFLYPLVESSLPSDILKIWHRHPSSGYGMELAKREESDKGVGGAQERLRLLLDFLKAEVRSAQRLKFVEKGFKQEEPYKRSYNDGTRTRSNFRPATVSSLFGGRTNIKCFFCERTNHASHQCRSIMKMSPGERNDKIRSAHLCFKCLRKRHIQSKCREQLECKNCGRNHLEVLCEGNSSNRQACTGQVLLMTTVALLRGPNASKRVRILLDSGSQFSYIKQSLVWSVGIERKGEITIAKSLFGGNKIGEEKHGKFMLELENLGNKRDVIHIEALDQRKICDAIPPLPKGDWLEKLKIKGIILSQDNFKGQEIDILIGANYLGMILTGKIVQVEADLTAVETKLGWTLMGNSPIIDSNDNVQQTLNLLTTRCDLKDLWDLEVLGIRDPVETCSKETRYQEIKEKFITKIQRQSDQRYSVGLPWKVEKESIPSNLDIAIKRLDISTKKMTSQNKLTEYSQIFRDWLTEGLIERVEGNPLERRGYYLPHRPVYKMESKTTPIRPVFDASCLGHNGLSLNQCLEKGPNLLERIPEMMIRFRENKFGVTADIRKAFQMVAIEESERNYLRFLWWEKESDRELIAYRHKRLVFGLNCSPFVLNAVIEYHLQSIRGPLVQWAKILAQSFYMDNCITSLETKQEVQEFQKAAIEIMDRAKMDLREWEYSLEENPEKGTCTKILGVVWNKMEDSLKCELPDILSLQPKLTKRLVLSMVQRIFDPLGFCAPVFLPPKLLLQRSWGLKLGWDTPLPESMAQEFRTWLDQIKLIELIKIPRYMWNDLIFPTEVHIFCDASQIGYGAVAYLRSETGRENTLTLIWSKVRLAPMKSITIPRLELMAMVLGARLANAIQAALKRKCETTLWSDSTTALSWIKKEIEWRVFVRNRVREIQATTNLNDWRFVPSQLNPADLLSRGCPPSQFVQSRWWEGPEWLKKPKEFWPNSEFSINPKEIKVEENIMKTNINLNIDYKDWLLTRRSNYSLNIRVMSYVLRFLGKLKKQSTETGPLKVSELDLAEKKLIRMIQEKGSIEKIYSDNGTNFAKLNRIFKRLDWIRIERETSIERIQWIFIPPSAPWWGGFWERMVRTIKEMLIKMLGHRELKYVQLQTALCEIESIINNRPLTYVSEDDNDLKPLTPNEFLQNGPESSFPEFENLKPEMLHTRYRELGQLKRELKQRFLKEYLGALIQKSENIDRRQLKVGDVVLIGQENLKRMFWPKGRIVNLIPGKDGIVRVAHVKTSTGTLIRALQRLHPLEISSNVKTILMDNSKTESQSDAFLGNRPNIESRDSRNRYGRLSCKQRLVEGKTSSYPASSVLWKERRQAILQAASCGRKDVKLSCKQRLVDGENALEYPSSSNLRAEKTLRQPTSRDNWTSHKTSQAKPSQACDGAATRKTLTGKFKEIFLSIPTNHGNKSEIVSIEKNYDLTGQPLLLVIPKHLRLDILVICMKNLLRNLWGYIKHTKESRGCYIGQDYTEACENMWAIVRTINS